MTTTKPAHPLDYPGPFSNVPEDVSPEEFRRRFRERADELLKQLNDPDWFSRQMFRR